MIPQAFINLLDACNECILSLESCIAAADSCEHMCEKQETCAVGAQDFLEKARETITSCYNCIKVCEEMIIQFKKESHDEHMEVLNKTIKILGECIRGLNASIDICSRMNGCGDACKEARDFCERALIAVDECIESCEKHKVFYEKVQPFKKY